MGRPSTFTREKADAILARLAEGETLRSVCRDEDMPPESTVRLWAMDDVDGFSAQYSRAREVGYHAMADELLDISDDGQNDWMERNVDNNPGWEANGEHLQRSRLRVDSRKWLLSKALPKVYGDKVVVGGDNTLDPIRTEETGENVRALKALVASIAERTGNSGETSSE